MAGLRTDPVMGRSNKPSSTGRWWSGSHSLGGTARAALATSGVPTRWLRLTPVGVESGLMAFGVHNYARLTETPSAKSASAACRYSR